MTETNLFYINKSYDFDILYKMMKNLQIGSTGPMVELLQSVLKKIGLFNGVTDGIFGTQTKNAVIAFQQRNGLIADGIVGVSTWRALRPNIDGFDIHIIKSGDTLYNIARTYSISTNKILTANPGIDIYNLTTGQKIVIPSGSIVPTDISYSYDILKLNINALKTVYPFLETGSIGNSAQCKKIPYIRIGAGQKQIFYNASIHANEWITTTVLMKFIEDFSNAYTNRQSIYGYSAEDIFRNTSIYIVPMLNPDGVDLVTGALDKNSESYINAQNIAGDYPWIPFPQGWKANIEGIDLNLQFPANWELAKEIKFAQGFISPAPRDFVGDAPLTAQEALALYDFTLEHDFKLMITYHTQGKVIFWKYLDYLPEQSYYIGRMFAESSGYSLEETPYASSFAGFKDWFIQEYNRPGYTIEAGIGINPLPISQFQTIYNDNLGILILGAVLI